jgi:Na+-driven multidrug efflux pump
MKKKKINAFRATLAAAVCCAVMGIMLYLHNNQVQDLMAKIAEKENLANVEWLVKYLSYILPIVPVIIALTVYYTVLKDDAIVMHKEKTLASIVLIAFTYAFLLPVVASKKEPIGESEKTMLDISVNWFAFQAVPMLVMLLYHSSMTEEETDLAEEKEESSPEEKKEEE